MGIPISASFIFAVSFSPGFSPVQGASISLSRGLKPVRMRSQRSALQALDEAFDPFHTFFKLAH